MGCLKESRLNIELLILLLLGFDAHLGVELVPTMSVFGESLGKSEKFGSRLQLQIWGMIESKQCEDELDLIISFD